MWLPIYGVILLLAVMRLGVLRGAWVGALMTAPLLLLALISSEWSILPDVTVRRTIALGFTTLFGLWLAARFTWREVVGLVAGASVVLALGSYIAALLAPGFGVHSDIHPGAWRGLWYEKNTTGAIMAQGALACACASVLSPARRTLWLVGTALCAGLVLLSTSTTALLALLIVGAGFVTVAGLRRGGALAVTTSWIVLVVTGVAAGLYAFAPELVFEALGKDATLTGRTDIWGAVLRRVQERPMLGYGFGAFWEDKGGPVGFVHAEVDWSAPTAHNGWLELLLGLGWTGVALFGLQLLVVATAAVVSLRRGPESYWALLFLSLFALFSLSESTIMQQNNLSWALYVMTAAKLFMSREAALAPAASTPRPALAARAPSAAWAPRPTSAAAAVSAPASRASFILAVGALIIFSKIWLPVVFGGEAPETVGGKVQIVYVFAYLAAGVLASRG
jgi:O-antigen ligase